MNKLLFPLKAAVPPFGPLMAVYYAAQTVDALKPEFVTEASEISFVTSDKKVEIKNINGILRALNNLYPSQLGVQQPIAAAQVEYWMDFAQDQLFLSDFKKLSANFDKLDNHLTLRSFIVGYDLTTADFAIFGALKANAIFNKQLKNGKITAENLVRWYSHMNALDAVKKAVNDLEAARDAAKDRSDKGSMAIPLEGAEMGKVVTRFPPEPSGYLHIGHAKAALLNNYFARSYNGKLIVRFDDTNPSKEKVEFEESIKEDLRLLGIKEDVTVHTSDHFDKIYEYAITLIKAGLAYVDDTDTETMRNERFEGIDSKNRNQSVATALEKFEEMKNATEYGQKCCLRAKIAMQDPNKCLRDPVIYRCNLIPHHITGQKWKMYPTYDFACPIVDSLDGVTHALRTIEYRDRNPQYQWFIDNLNLRKIRIWDYSRLAFVNTVLSKRKLQWFVDQGLVPGWDDPRFPTVRGIRRRGMTIEALLNYILSQGASQREILLEWDKIWAGNKKVIDPISPRFTAIAKEGMVKLQILDNISVETKKVLKHKKNADLGEKTVNYSKNLFVEQVDAGALEEGEEFTLMGWGNAIVHSIKKEDGVVVGVTVRLHLEGDFKKTKKKITWLSQGEKETELVDLILVDLDYLITKKKLEEDDKFEDFLNPVTISETVAIGDCDLRHLKYGEIIQLERKGYFICDKAWSKEDPVVKLISIPDGKADSVAIKNFGTKNSVTPKAEKTETIPMYNMNSIYNKNDTLLSDKMYKVDSIYANSVYHSSASAKSTPPQHVPAAVENPAKVKKEKAPKKSAPPEKVEQSLIASLDMVVGKVLDVKPHPDAETLYIETIDVGEKEPRTVISGLVKYMKPEEIMGKQLIILKNLKPVAMRGIKSYAMVMCASDAEHAKVEFLVPPANSEPGDKVFFEGHLGTPEPELKPKKKVFEKLQVDFTTRDDLVAVWNGVPFQTEKGLIKAKTLVGASIK